MAEFCWLLCRMMLIFLIHRSLLMLVEMIISIQVGCLHLPETLADHDVAVHVDDGGVIGFGFSEPSEFLLRKLNFLRILLRKLSELLKGMPKHITFLALSRRFLILLH